MTTSTRKCPSCSETQFVEGKLGAHVQTFIPRGEWMFLGYKMKAAVCLGCGYVHHYLPESELCQVREKVPASKSRDR